MLWKGTLCGGHVCPFILILYQRLNCLGFSWNSECEFRAKNCQVSPSFVHIGTVTVNSFILALPIFGNRKHSNVFYSVKCRMLLSHFVEIALTFLGNSALFTANHQHILHTVNTDFWTAAWSTVSAFKLLNSIWIFASSAQHELASCCAHCLWYPRGKFTRYKFRIPWWATQKSMATSSSEISHQGKHCTQNWVEVHPAARPHHNLFCTQLLSFLLPTLFCTVPCCFWTAQNLEKNENNI